MLSNLDLVTESFTLMAGKARVPELAISYSRCTPVVVSSVTPRMPSAITVQRSSRVSRVRRSRSSTTFHSSVSSSAADGTAPAPSYSAPLCTSIVASPPSSRIMFGPFSPGQVSAWSAHHQYSSSVSPFQANTGMPLGSSGVPSGPTATAAAAWSWVEKMLQLAHRTWAPSAARVSIRTAVWIVMCSDPVIRAPRSGCASAYSSRTAISPGISCSASLISLRPKSARDRSATLNGTDSAGMTLLSRVTDGSAPPTVRHRTAWAQPSGGFLNKRMLDSVDAHHGGRSAARHISPDAPLPGIARPAAPGRAGPGAPTVRRPGRGGGGHGPGAGAAAGHQPGRAGLRPAGAGRTGSARPGRGAGPADRAGPSTAGQRAGLREGAGAAAAQHGPAPGPRGAAPGIG